MAIDVAELTKEAREEWIARGLNSSDFTLAKMMALWEEDDRDDGIEDRLRDKQDMMNGNDVVYQAKQFVSKVIDKYKLEDVQKEAMQAAKLTWSYIEPPPIRHYRQLKQHLKIINEMNNTANLYHNIKQKFISDHENKLRVEREKAQARSLRLKVDEPRSKYLREMKNETEQTERKNVIDSIKAKKLSWINEEKAEKLLKKTRADIIFQLHNDYRRIMDEEYWKNKALEYKKQAKQLYRDIAQDKAARIKKIKDQLKQDEKNLLKHDHLDQTALPTVSSSQGAIGIFGTPMGVGEWASSIEGGNQPGADDHTIRVASDGPNSLIHELKRVELMDIQSRFLKLKEDLDSFDEDKEKIKSNINVLEERRNRLTEEVAQLDSEMKELLEIQAGPPRRDPLPSEIEQTHIKKARRAKLVSQLLELRHRERILNKDASSAVVKYEKTLKQLEITQKELHEAEADIKQREDKYLDLPAVVGRSIAKRNSNSSSYGVVAPPSEVSQSRIDILEKQTKFQILKSATEPVYKAYHDARQHRFEEWKLNQGKKYQENDVEDSISRLARIKDNLLKHQNDSIRSDLVNAIKKFSASDVKLQPTQKKSVGELDWWMHRNMSATVNIQPSEGPNHGYHVSDSLTGVLQGRLSLPFHAFWRISFEITSQIKNIEKVLTYSKRDSITLRLGSDEKALKKIGVYDVFGEKDEVLTKKEVVFEFVGAMFIYRFEFLASSTDINLRLVLSKGKYEEYLESETMVSMQNQAHIVSDFVRKMRIENSQGTQRASVLLEELIKVENSSTELFDSDVLHNYPQRFLRIDYINQLRKAIKEEVARSINFDVKKRRQDHDKGTRNSSIYRIEVPETHDEMDAEAPSVNVERSMARMIERKKEENEQVSHSALAKIGRRIEIFNPKKGVWHLATVKGVRAEVKAAGMSLLLFHKLNIYKKESNIYHQSNIDIQEEKVVYLANDIITRMLTERTCYTQSRIQKRENEEATKKAEKAQAALRELEEAGFASSKNMETKSNELKLEKEQEMARQRQKSRSKAEILAKKFDGRLKIEAKSKVIGGQRVDSSGSKLSKAEIWELAKEEFIQEVIAADLVTAERLWNSRSKRNERRLEKTEVDLKQNLLREVQNFTFIKDLRDRQEQQELQMRREKYKELLQIPNFELAKAKLKGCQHEKVKFWGGKYGLGIKCQECMQEISKLYEDPDHARGCDPELDKKVEQHRQNEGAFRFVDSEDLTRVEKERIRLEKEARELELSEVQFYDYDKTEAIYKLNRRHHLQRINDLSDNSRNATRNLQDRHLASFHNELAFFQRINNFRIRISKLLGERAGLMRSYVEQNDLLEELHGSNQKLEDKLAVIDVEQQNAKGKLDCRNLAIASYIKSRKMLKKALNERKLAYQAREGVEDEAKLVEAQARTLKKAMDAMEESVIRSKKCRKDFEEALKEARQIYDKCAEDREKLDGNLTLLYYRKKGRVIRTLYGPGTVQYYRSEDSFLLVKLHFGKARAFVSLSSIFQQERLREESERQGMINAMKENIEFYKEEHAQVRRELSFMREEEITLRPIIHFQNESNAYEQKIRKMVEKIEIESHVLVHEGEIAEKLKHKMLVEMRELTRAWKRDLTHAEKIKFSHASTKRLQMQYVEEQILLTESREREMASKIRDDVNISKCVCEVFEKSLSDILLLVAEECINDSYESTAQAEMENSLAFSAESMPYHIYQPMQRLWIKRKSNVRNMMNAWKRQNQALQAAKERMKRYKNVQAKRLERRKALDELNRPMRIEELRCRKFYQDEIKFCLKQRRAMKIEEMHMKEFLRQEQIELMRQKFAHNDEKRATDKERRRFEIKVGKREIKKMRREWREITDEDERASAIREKELEARRIEAEEKEAVRVRAMMNTSDGSDDDSYDDEGHEYGFLDLDEPIPTETVVELPAQATSMPNKDETDEERRKRFRKERKKKRKQKLREAWEMKRAAFQAKINDEHNIFTVETFFEILSAEYALMQAEEKFHFLLRQCQIKVNDDNYIQSKGKEKAADQEEMHAIAIQKRNHSDACFQRCEKADLQVSKCTKEAMDSDQNRIVVIQETRLMDTSVMHNRVQRFRTDFLYKALDEKYFETLVIIYALRAQTVSIERKKMGLVEQLQANLKESSEKGVIIKTLWRKKRRKDLMRLRRQELSKMIFGGTRKKVLHQCFVAWTRYWTDCVNIRSKTEMRFSMIYHEKLLDSYSRTQDGSIQQVEKNESRIRPTIMQRHQLRRLKCRHCNQEYTEATNHRLACSYHPQPYELACPKSCESRHGGLVRSSCMEHRTKRWLCCDKPDEGLRGSTGCRKRFHMPPEVDPHYKKLRADVDEEESIQVNALDQRLEQIARAGYFRSFIHDRKQAVRDVTAELAQQRETAARFDTLKK